MARRRYRKYFRYPKKRWAANIKTIPESENPHTIEPGSFYFKTELCRNPVQSDLSVSQQYTVKNPEFTFELESQNRPDLLESLTCYICFVPQGMQVTETYPNLHPEYIMASRFIGSPSSNSSSVYRNPIKVRSRLARRLQTGDSIVALITGVNNQVSITNSVNIHGLIRWWTKAN